MSVKTFLTVRQLVEKHKAFTIGSLRFLIFREYENGLVESGAIVRIGRKVLIDESKFFDWVETQNIADQKNSSARALKKDEIAWGGSCESNSFSKI